RSVRLRPAADRKQAGRPPLILSRGEALEFCAHESTGVVESSLVNRKESDCNDSGRLDVGSIGVRRQGLCRRQVIGRVLPPATPDRKGGPRGAEQERLLPLRIEPEARFDVTFSFGPPTGPEQRGRGEGVEARARSAVETERGGALDASLGG